MFAMRFLKCMFLCVAISSYFCPVTVAHPCQILKSESNQYSYNASALNKNNFFLPKASNETFKKVSNGITQLIVTDPTNSESKIGENFTTEISNDKLKGANLESSVLPKLNSKREIENESLKAILKPISFFPTFPFLFPRDNDLTSLKRTNSPSEIDDRTEDDGKPLIFFKLALNIRQIPLANITNNANDSKIINVKKLSFKNVPTEDHGKIRENEKKIQSSISDKEINGFFDDFPMFPDSDIEEFFPKPDLFFPNLLFHRTPLRKLSRRKRANKTSVDFKDDLKFFLNMFDETFTKTKREFEQANPFLDFLRGGEEAKKDGNIFASVSSARNLEEEAPNWTKQRNVIGLMKNHDGALKNLQESLEMENEKVIKTGDSNFYNSSHEKLKMRKRRKGEILNGRKNTDAINQESNMKFHKSDAERVKHRRQIKKKRHHEPYDLRKGRLKMETKFIRILPNSNATSKVLHGKNDTDKTVQPSGDFKIANIIRKVVNSTENVLNYTEDLIKMINALESNAADTIDDSKVQKRESDLRLPQMSTANREKKNLKTAVYEDLRKNISNVLNQFLKSFKKLDEDKIDGNESESFDWTEKETLQNSNIFWKRSKKEVDFVDEYLDKEVKGKQIANLNYLLVTVTLPTIIISTLFLVACFVNLQAKGALCKKLFKPRQVFGIEKESINPIKEAEKF